MRVEWICILVVLQLTSVWSQSSFSGQKTAEFIKRKFANYDKAVRPYFGEKPATVTVSGYVLDVFDIDETNQEFSLTLYLRHEWKDPRMEFTESEAGTEKILLSQEYAQKMWRADSFILNERESKGHSLFTDHEYTKISPDGTVMVSARFTIKASCKMELGWFPFDRHTCPIIIESYGHTTTDFVYQWRQDETGSVQNAIKVSKELSSLRFNVAAVNVRQEEIALGPKSYSRLALEFFFIRASTRFVHEVYFPAIILTLLSFVTLLFATGTPKARLQISIFVESLMIISMALSAKTMPPVSYQTALDFYICVCLMTISCVVAINVVICLMITNESTSNGVVRLQNRPSTDEQSTMDSDGKEVFFDVGPRFSTGGNRIVMLLVKLRLVIPFLFLVFNLLYWMIVMIGSSSYPEDFLILDNGLTN